MARRSLPPKKKKKKAETRDKSKKIYFSGGERDGESAWIATPLPKSLKWNLGRDNYFQSESDPSVYEYDPLREITYED